MLKPPGIAFQPSGYRENEVGFSVFIANVIIGIRLIERLANQAKSQRDIMDYLFYTNEFQ
ncbi:hypothetical protein [Kluyvera huaxiensis]|uniref:hypothetical protein n=1 Tax=Kluyvera sp. 142053 TaxID=3160979 RepID=UPI0032E01185